MASANAAVRKSHAYFRCTVRKSMYAEPHSLLQFRVHVVLVPAELLHVLHPLEIAHRHATGVRINVRQHRDPLLLEDRVGVRIGRVVGRPR